MKKGIIIAVSVISFLFFVFVGYVLLDVFLLNPDYARTVDRAVIVESGEEMTKNAKSAEEIAKSIDCENFEYDWAKEDFTCEQGKKVLEEAVKTEVALGEVYKQFAGTEKISKEHIEKTVKLIDAYLATLEKARGRFSDSNAEIDEQIKIIKEHRANFAEILR